MPSEIIFGIAVIAAVVVYVTVKMHFDEKKGEDSEEKKAIAALIKKIVPEGESYTPAYAYWEIKTRYSVRSWYYAIGFNSERIYIVPLSFAGKEMSYGDYSVLEKKNLGLVNGQRDAKVMSWATFYDEEQKEIISLWVNESNTRDYKYHPVNIQQKEAMAAFARLVNQWMDEVNTAHGVTASGRIGVPLKKQK